MNAKKGIRIDIWLISILLVYFLDNKNSLFIIEANAMEIKLKNPSANTTYNVYKNSTVDEFFRYRKHYDICDCSSKFIYFEQNVENKFNTTHFEIKANEEEIKKVIVKSKNKNIETKFTMKKVDQGLINLDVTHKCINKHKDNDKYWGVIDVDLYLSLETMEKINFQFVKFCKAPEVMGSLLTTLMLFAMSTLFVGVSTYSEISLEISEIKQEGEIKYWHSLLLILSGSLVLILIFYFFDFINYAFTILITFQISLAFYLCLKTLYEYLGFPTHKKFQNMNRKVCVSLLKIFKTDMEVYSFIILIITILTVIAYLLTKHWILNNIFGFCLVFTILSLFHIRSFKICAILLMSAFLYDVFWVYFSPYFFTQNVMVVAATSMNLPIKLEIPIFFETHPLKSCMFLGLGDLVLPGFVLKFCHRFDFLKNTKVYYISSLLLYVFALVLSGLAIAIVKYPQPVLFYMCPVLLIGIGIVAKRRNEGEIWNAEILEENLQVIFESTTGSMEHFSDLESKHDFSFTETTDSNSSSDDKVI